VDLVRQPGSEGATVAYFEHGGTRAGEPADYLRVIDPLWGCRLLPHVQDSAHHLVQSGVKWRTPGGIGGGHAPKVLSEYRRLCSCTAYSPPDPSPKAPFRSNERLFAGDRKPLPGMKIPPPWHCMDADTSKDVSLLEWQVEPSASPISHRTSVLESPQAAVHVWAGELAVMDDGSGFDFPWATGVGRVARRTGAFRRGQSIPVPRAGERH
jgi:hypothetical protein